MGESEDRLGILPAVLYLILSILFFGRGLLGHFSTLHVGEGADPLLTIWFLDWWPYAIAHRLDPFVTHLFWAPHGLNLTWSTCIPLISVLASPITSAFGPIASFNALCLLGLPLAGWCGFVLCRYISGAYWASILGGYVFGFCPTLQGQLLFGRLHSTWIFPVPLAVYFILRRYREEITARCLVLVFSTLLVSQFLFSPETFVTTTLFLAIAWALAWILTPGEGRERVTRMIPPLMLAYVVATTIISPYLYAFFTSSPYGGTVWSDRVTSGMLSADLLNFIVPTPTNLVGQLSWFDHLSGRFNSGLVSDEGAFLSWPLILFTVLFARMHGRELEGRFLLDLLGIILLCALGPILIVRGWETSIGLPWALFQVSALKNAAPVRFCAYAYLIFAIVTAVWFSRTIVKPVTKYAFAAIIFVCLLPNVSAGYWNYPVNVPKFFSNGLYRSYLQRDESIFVLPFWPRNESMLWQAETSMYFRLAQGPGPWPKTVARWPILEAFLRRLYVPDFPAQFLGYLAAHHVNTVIAADYSMPLWAPLLSTLDVTPIEAGGVHIYKLPSALAFSATTPLSALRVRFDYERFNYFLTRISDYVERGGNLEDLIATNSVTLGLLPAEEIIGPPAPAELRDRLHNWDRRSNLSYGMVLFVTPKHSIVIGEEAWGPSATLF